MRCSMTKHELSSVDHFISTVKNRQHPTNRVVLWNNTWYHITQFEYKNNTMAIGSDEFQYTKLALAAENLASVALHLKIKLPTKNKWPTMYLHDKKSCWIFRTQDSKRSVPILSLITAKNAQADKPLMCSLLLWLIASWRWHLAAKKRATFKSLIIETLRRSLSFFLLVVSLLFLLNSPLENFGIFV